VVSIRGLILLVAPPLVGVALGYLVAGRLSGLRTIRVRALWLVWLAAVVQAAQYYAPALRDAVESIVPMLAIVFVLVIVWLALNLPRWPVAIRVAGVVIALGALLNGLVIALNGRMPYAPAVAEAVGLPPLLTTAKNEPADDETRLSLLGDTIPIAPLRKVISPGDVLIGGGTAALVALAMRRHRRDESVPVPVLTMGGES
jgi:Family of unknown function (DUF5317)